MRQRNDLLLILRGGAGTAARRDTALLRVTFELGLRRGEVVALDLSNVADVANLGPPMQAAAVAPRPAQGRDEAQVAAGGDGGGARGLARRARAAAEALLVEL